MRIVFCWPIPSGYMAACWRELAARPGVAVLVVAFDHLKDCHTEFRNDELLRDVPHRLLSGPEQKNARLIHDLVADFGPDVVCVSGWGHAPYRALARSAALGQCRFVMAMDNPRRYDLRQALGRWLLRPFVRRMDRVFVTGERCWQLARYLGAREECIGRGTTYGVDWAGLSPAYEQRMRRCDGWPRRFLFVGRYAPIKGVPVLLDAYRRYRGTVRDPWPLATCGSGPLKGALQGEDGIEDLGFRQPSELLAVMASSGVFVLPSLHDPWPLALVEHCAAGLPVICSEACGSAVELVRPRHNGLFVATGNEQALADAMVWMHEHYERLPEMGRISLTNASAYSAQNWADRVLAALGQPEPQMAGESLGEGPNRRDERRSRESKVADNPSARTDGQMAGRCCTCGLERGGGVR